MLSTDVGLTGFEPSSGQWTVSRYDGTQYSVESAPVWTSPSTLQDVQTADLWGRGTSDLIGYDPATGSWQGTWEIGSGQTTAQIAGWVPGVNYQHIVTGDFNGDGRTDIAGWDPGSGKVAQAKSQPGGFSSQVVAVWSPRDIWQDIAVGDFNHDGYADLCGFDATTGDWHVLLGSPNGLGSDQVVAHWNPSAKWQNLTTGGFYSDGETDILGYDSGTGNWHVISWTGTAFQDRVVGNWNPAQHWLYVGVADFWGNGQGMIVGFNPASGVWQGTWAIGTGTSTATVAGWKAGATYADLHVQTIDGTHGVAFVGLNTSTGQWFASKRNGTYSQTSGIGKWDASVKWQNVLWGDVNGDGIADIVGYNPANGMWTGLLSGVSGYSTQTLGAWSTLNNYTNVQLAAPRATGPSEIIGRDQGTWNWYELGQTNGNFQVQSLTPTTPTGSNWQFVQTADLQGDNSGDLAGWNPATGDWWVTLWPGAENSSQKIAYWDPTAKWQNVTAADFYGNGKTDIIGYNATTGDWHVISYNGSTFQDRVVGHWSPQGTWQFAGIGDIWGTGQNAIVGFNTTTDVWWATWAIGSGTSTAAIQYWTTGRKYTNLHLQDTNGDGRMDWVGFDTTSGKWYAGYSPGAGKLKSTVLGTWNASVAWTNVCWGDLNGDGLPDIIGFNPAKRTWAVLMSNSGGAYQLQSIAAPAAQGNWSKVLIGDVDGNGPAELLGYSSSTGNWQALNWINGGFSVQTLGKWNPGDWSQMQLADVNGDGLPDIVGFDSQSNTWSVVSDVGGQFVTTQVARNAGTQFADLSAGAVAGLSNATLRRQILQQIPDLAATLKSSTLDTANLLLNWAANAANFAMQPQYLLQSPHSAADAFYNYFQTNTAGQSCGGFAWFYSSILKLFNIDSLNVGVGIGGTDLTHVFVVIPQMQNGNWEFSVFDPTFNVTYSTPDSTYADYFELMSLASSGQTDSIAVNQGTFPDRHFLSATPQSSDGFTLIAIQNSTYVYTQANYGLHSFIESYQPVFQQYGYAADLSGYLQFLASDVLVLISNSSDPSARNAFIDHLAAAQIPYSGN